MASQGDPRVLFALNLVLSAVFSVIVVTGFTFVGLGTFTWANVGVATLTLMLLTWLLILR